MENSIKASFLIETKDMGDRTLEITGSNELQDRDREVLKANGWETENYLKNPVVLFAHDNHQPPVAKTEEIKVSGEKMIFKIKFPKEGDYPFADTIYKLYRGGFMNASSVGFIPKEWQDGNGEKGAPFRTYTKQELLELSLVPVPSNPMALVHSRSLEKAWKDNAISDKEWEELCSKIKDLKKDDKEEIKGSDDLKLKELCDDLKKEVELLKKDIKELKEERTKYDLLLLRTNRGDTPILADEDEGIVEMLKEIKEELNNGELK